MWSFHNFRSRNLIGSCAKKITIQTPKTSTGYNRGATSLPFEVKLWNFLHVYNCRWIFGLRSWSWLFGQAMCSPNAWGNTWGKQLSLTLCDSRWPSSLHRCRVMFALWPEPSHPKPALPQPSFYVSHPLGRSRETLASSPPAPSQETADHVQVILWWRRLPVRKCPATVYRPTP